MKVCSGGKSSCYRVLKKIIYRSNLSQNYYPSFGRCLVQDGLLCNYSSKNNSETKLCLDFTCSAREIRNPLKDQITCETSAFYQLYKNNLSTTAGISVLKIRSIISFKQINWYSQSKQWSLTKFTLEIGESKTFSDIKRQVKVFAAKIIEEDIPLRHKVSTLWVFERALNGCNPKTFYREKTFSEKSYSNNFIRGVWNI